MTFGRFGRLLAPNFDAALLEETPHKRRDFTLAQAAFVKRIYAVDAHEIGERFDDGWKEHGLT